MPAAKEAGCKVGEAIPLFHTFAFRCTCNRPSLNSPHRPPAPPKRARKSVAAPSAMLLVVKLELLHTVTHLPGEGCLH